MEKVFYLGLMVECIPGRFLLINDMVLEYFVRQIYQNSRSELIISGENKLVLISLF